MTGRATRPRLPEALDDHFFEPMSLRRLAIFRIVVVAAQLLLFLPELDYQMWLASIDDSLFMPRAALRVLMSPFGWAVRPDAAFLQMVWGAAVVSGVAAVAGLYSRISLFVFAAANTLLIGHTYAYEEIHHTESLIVIALWILAFSRAGEALSLDALGRRRKAVRGPGRAEDAGGEVRSDFARWPLRLMQWMMVLAYLSAAVSKLKHGGLDWFNGHTLAYFLVQDGVRKGAMGIAVADQIELLVVLSIFAFLFEATFAAAVLVPRSAWMYVAWGLGLHLGIYVLQEAPFFQWMVLYACFVDELLRYGPGVRVRAWLARRTSAVGPAAGVGSPPSEVADGIGRSGLH